MRKTNRILSMVLVLCMLLSIMPMGTFAVNITEKPANGTTVGQPFPAGAGGSANFRIPGFVTLDNGTLIAACDARWNHTGDGAGLDTIVAVSTDNGGNWTNTFANYLGDNGNVYNNLSTCIIDPAIGTDGATAYLIADLFPAGIALNTSRYAPVAGENGFDDNGNLMLRALANDTVAIGQNGYNTMAANASYNYYLDLTTLKLYAYGANGAEDALVEGYTVDAYFNIVSADGSVNTNLFFSDSPYQPYPTDYLYLTTSTDGLTWSVPTLLNLQEENEQTLLIGPGNGTYNEVTGHMVFTAYEYTSGYQRTSLIWMDEEGNWSRTADATGSNWSSEATAVVLADGTVRCFYRDAYTILRYTDFVWSESEGNYLPDPGAYEVNTAATKTYNNQLSAILYSEQVDGKDAILVSTANTGTNARRNGTLYVFLVEEDNSMELAYAYDILPGTDDYYAYSCITEMADGRIGLLYEGDDGGNSTGRIIFKILDMDEITSRDNDARLSFTEVNVLTKESVTVTDNSGYYGDADTGELDTDVATLVLSGEEIVSDAARLGSDATYSGEFIDLAACRYSFTKNEDGAWVVTSTDASGNTVYLYPANTTSAGYPNASSFTVALNIYEGYEDGTFCIYSPPSGNNGSYLYFDRSGLRWDRVTSPGSNATWQTNVSLMLYRLVDGDGSEEIPGYERVTELADITDGTYLVVGPGNDGNLYALYPNTSTANRYCQIAKLLGRTVVGHTDLTFTGVGAGYTEVQVGSTVYQVSVADYAEEYVTVPVGEVVTFSKAADSFDLSSFDSKYAIVEVAKGDGIIEVVLCGEYPGTTTLIVGRTRYNIEVTGEVMDVELKQGESASFLVGGNHMDADLSALDTVVAEAEMSLVAAGQVSTGTTYLDEYVELADCLYTFQAIEGGYFQVSATTAEGETVYLNHFSTPVSQVPNCATPGKIAVSASSYTNMFKLVAMNIDGSSAANRSLHFHMEAAMPYWNRCGNDTSMKCHEYLYRPVAEGEASSAELPGYVLVTDIAQIVDGGKYLIVAKDDAGLTYVLHPSATTSDKFAHVAKVSAGTQVTFTAVGGGETTLRLGSTIFDIDVHSHSYDYSVEVIQPATCEEDGLGKYFCACGESIEDVIPATGHDYEDGVCGSCGQPDPDAPVEDDGFWWEELPLVKVYDWWWKKTEEFYKPIVDFWQDIFWWTK